jgi:hypothetical protein
MYSLEKKFRIEECRRVMCGSCKNRRFGRTYHPHQHLLVTANFFLRSLTLCTLMMEKIRISETSVLTRAIRHHIAEDGIPHSHHRKNHKSYKFCYFSLTEVCEHLHAVCSVPSRLFLLPIYTPFHFLVAEQIPSGDWYYCVCPDLYQLQHAVRLYHRNFLTRLFRTCLNGHCSLSCDFFLSWESPYYEYRCSERSSFSGENGVFWDGTPCGSCKNRCFERT